MMNDILFLELLEAAVHLVEIKDKRNPLVKSFDRAEEYAYMQLKTAVENIEGYLKDVADQS